MATWPAGSLTMAKMAAAGAAMRRVAEMRSSSDTRANHRVRQCSESRALGSRLGTCQHLGRSPVTDLTDLLPPAGSDPVDVARRVRGVGSRRRTPAVHPPGGGGARPRRRRTRRAGDADRFGQEPGRHRRHRARAATPVDVQCGPRRSRPSSPRSSSISSTCSAPSRSVWPPVTRRSTPVRRCSCARQRCWRTMRSRTAPTSDFGFACLDEFHYYADRDRGWAWQIPLLELTNCQMLLASATLGDMTAITTDLERRSGRSVTAVTSVDRPTPLYHQWRMTSVADSVLEAVNDGSQPGVRRPRQPGRSDRASPSAGQHARDHSDAARSDRRGASPARSMGRGLRRDARPADPQRCRRPPRRDAPPLPPSRRTAGRRRACCR